MKVLCAPSRKCRHRDCPRRAVRQCLCPDHWFALWGDSPAPPYSADRPTKAHSAAP